MASSESKQGGTGMWIGLGGFWFGGGRWKQGICNFFCGSSSPQSPSQPSCIPGLVAIPIFFTGKGY